MRASLVASATFLLVGGAAGVVGALDNVALQGSDTLEEVTKDVIAACPGAKNANITYRGGGSSTGENAMVAGSQTVSPMSRFLNPTTGVCAKGPTAEGLVIGLDGLSIVAGETNANACGSAAVYNSKIIPVLDANGNPVVNCVGCAAGTNNYQIQDWRDMLALVFTGKHHVPRVVVQNPDPARPDTQAWVYDCNGPVRRSLVNSWANLFQGACSGSSCTQLAHAFRRTDLSGTTDTLLALLGVDGLPLAQGAPGASRRPNIFCNAYGPDNTYYEKGTEPAGVRGWVGTFGGQGDYLDRDPIRRPCHNNEQVCASDGTLGLVVPMHVAANLTQAQNYPTRACSTGFFRLMRPGTGISVCPNGGGLLIGKCFQPAFDNGDGTYDSDCLNSRTNIQGFARNGMRDGRAYNLILRTADGVYRRDNLNRPVIGAYARIHSTQTIQAGAATCQKGSETEQIGCLVQANRCTIGFAGREAEQQAGTTALSINGLFPTTANIEALVTTPSTADDYVLSRKLYLTTVNGFENVTGGELELAKCMSNGSIMTTVMNKWNFVPVPGGPICQDFDETQSGCPAPRATVNNNACANNPAGVAQ
jgi:hypothetical protein